MAVRKEDVLAWLEALQQVYAENRQLLTDLDSAIGDADHGINMDRGFTAVKAELRHKCSGRYPVDSPSSGHRAHPNGRRRRRTACTALSSFGPAMAASGKTELDAADVVAMFQAGIEGVQQRGRAVAGDKTMVDALLPALAAMRASLEGGAGLAKILDEGAAAAEAGMRATIPMQARKGRASYLGERSIGHQDPGATSSYLLLKTAATVWGHPNNS